MTEKQALKEAKRRWGTNGACSYRKGALLLPERQAAQRRCKELRETIKAMKDRKEHVAVIAEELRQEQGKQFSIPCTVGRIELGMFLSVKGQGDTWELAFYDADWTEASEHDRYFHKSMETHK